MREMKERIPLPIILAASIAASTVLLTFFAPPAAAAARPSPLRTPPRPFAAHLGHPASCQPISTHLCADLPYNDTSYPNLVGNENQVEAAREINTFNSLIEAHCSNQLKFFLCSVYFPMCNMQAGESNFRILIGPCKPLCESVRKRCQPILQQFGFPWPPSLNCSKFPENNDETAMCMPGHGDEKEFGGSVGTEKPTRPSPTPAACTPTSTNYIYVNKTGDCALKCDSNGQFTSQEKTTAETLSFVSLLIGGVLSISSIIIMGVSSRNHLYYPDSPVQFMVGAFAFGTIPPIARWFAGRQVACTLFSQTSVLVVPGLLQTGCSVLAIIMYASWNGQQLWWLILCLSNFLSKGLNWSPEAITRWSFWYHFFVWGTSCLSVVLALISHAVDASELFGMCGVGTGETAKSRTMLLYFYIVPDLIILCLSLVLLLFGLLGHLCSSRNSSKLPNVPGNSWSGLMIATLCIPFFASHLIACFLQYNNFSTAPHRTPPLSAPIGVHQFSLYGTQILKLLSHSLSGIVTGLGLIWMVRAWDCGASSVRRLEDKSRGPCLINKYPHQPVCTTPIRVGFPNKYPGYPLQPSIHSGEHPVI